MVASHPGSLSFILRIERGKNLGYKRGQIRYVRLRKATLQQCVTQIFLAQVCTAFKAVVLTTS